MYTFRLKVFSELPTRVLDYLIYPFGFLIDFSSKLTSLKKDYFDPPSSTLSNNSDEHNLSSSLEFSHEL